MMHESMDWQDHQSLSSVTAMAVDYMGILRFNWLVSGERLVGRAPLPVTAVVGGPETIPMRSLPQQLVLVCFMCTRSQ